MNVKTQTGSVLIMTGFLLLPGASSLSVPGNALVLQRIMADAVISPQSRTSPIARFSFNGNIENATEVPLRGMVRGRPSFVEGLEGEALALGAEPMLSSLTLASEQLLLSSSQDFSVQFWIRTVVDSGRQFVVLSQKTFEDNSLASQKQPGWVFYVSNGTLAWNMGSGDRRITYERENGIHMPLNDGRWHQLTMTYSGDRAEVRLFYDGDNKVWYKVKDADGFDFTNPNPLVVGWDGRDGTPSDGILPIMRRGAEHLQELVDAFNTFDLVPIEPEELLPLVVDPRRLFDQKVEERVEVAGADSARFREAMEAVVWEPVAEAKSRLMSNPYTVHQNLNFTGIAPLSKVYALVDGKVTIQTKAAKVFAEKEWLSSPEFDMDNLVVWDRVLSPEEVLASYSEFFKPALPEPMEVLSSIRAGSWNIWHGGKHFSVDRDGWDSREAIAEIIRRENADVVMMQETYSSGDFIAAELGYYFATTVDWDYLNQGANISVLSRYPIKELHVQEDSPFQNVGVKIAISRTQDLYAMSNWYGMDQFPAVFDFHQARFDESDSIPTLFAGDFNAVPHTDGGDSPASRALLEAGFTDAFRSLYPNPEEHPGPSHRNGRRIDQLYYKGAGLRNTSTRVISTWPPGFPSDHYLILSSFDLDYFTRGGGR